MKIHRIAGMDTCFWNVMGGYPLEQRCEMLAELGFDDVYMTLMNQRVADEDLPRLSRLARENGLGVMAIFAGISSQYSESVDTAIRALAIAAQCDSGPLPALEVAINATNETPKSSSEYDDQVLPVLERLAKEAEKTGIDISLYPHSGYWMERVADALRLAKQIAHPRIKVAFPAFHWWNIDGDDLEPILTEVAPFLRTANISGGGSVADTNQIMPLDQGRLDPFAIMAGLNRHGYKGPIGIQGWNIGGDSYARLKRAKEIICDIEARIERHPHWGKLDFQQKAGSK